jgi:flagellar motility protein MotE (MotC chaperone)
MAETANQDIQHLAQMYGAMKPDQAAGIFNQMDAGFAAGFLRLIPSDQAGLILANMENEKAYIVSVKIASTNSDLRNDMLTP